MSDEKPADTGKIIWPKTPLGPFRYLAAGGESYEYKDGKWVDSEGKAHELWLEPREETAHRP